MTLHMQGKGKCLPLNYIPGPKAVYLFVVITKGSPAHNRIWIIRPNIILSIIIFIH